MALSTELKHVVMCLPMVLLWPLKTLSDELMEVGKQSGFLVGADFL